MSLKRSFLLAVALLLAGHVGFVVAQSGRSTLTGTVTDSSGAVVPNAHVTVTNQASGVSYSAFSTSVGTYAVADLPVGTYSVRVEKTGFKVIDRSGVVLSAASAERADFALQVGTTKQVVVVQGGATAIETEDARVSANISNKMVEQLPIVVGGALRSPFDLAVLTPEAKNYGTSVALAAAPGPSYSSDSFSIGGGQARAYGITLDGVSMGTGNPLPNSWVTYNTPPLDAITEFTVDTTGFKAEFGHASGGTMTFSSKSGTNQLHGSAFDFLRNTDLDSNYYFSNANGIPRSVYKQNDFGVSAGGPVYIPHLYDGKDKTFFFAAYEGFRNRVGATAAAETIPTPEMLTGDFSNWVNSQGQMIQIYDPNSTTTDPSGNVVRTPYFDNQISPTEFDPLAEQLVQVYESGPNGTLTPNNGAAPGTVGYVQNNYLVTQGSTLTPWNKISLKFDHNFTAKSHASFYFGRNTESNLPGPDGPPALPGYYSNFQSQRNSSYVYRGDWTYGFTPTWVNYFYAGVNVWRQYASSASQDEGNWKSKFCYPNVPDCNVNLTTLLFGSDGYSQWGSYADSGSDNPIISFNDDVTWVHGRHVVKFGGTYQKNYYSGFGEQGISGEVGFSTTETGLPGVTNFAQGGGNSFASFLLGQADSGRTETVRFIGQEFRYIAGFVQDDFHVSSRLTVNAGLRWETTLPPIAEHNEFSDFSPTTPNPAAGNILGALVFAGTGPGRIGRSAIAPPNFNGFGPRLSFAYRLGDKTVVRSGYSRSFGFLTCPSGSAHYLGFVTIFTPANTTSGVEPTWLFKNGFPSYPLPPQINPSFGNGNTVQWWNGRQATLLPTFDAWTLSIERQLPANFLLETAYSGSKGTHLQAGIFNENQTPYADFQQYGPTILNSNINSPAAIAAGLTPPYPGFNGSVAQALRPYPQFLTIDTQTGGGDHTGDSTYNAAIFQIQKRYGNGLTVQSSYVFSKLLSNSDSTGSLTYAMEQENRKLEKSISGFDITHNFKLAWIYDLPFGKNKSYFTSGVPAALFGGWRVSAIQFYSSGLPVGVSTTVALPIFAGPNRPTINSYDGWGCSSVGHFNPFTTNFFNTTPFVSPQPSTTFGNSTRFNPKCRQFPNLNENSSVNRTFHITEKMNLDFRWEAFNVFNRVRFSTGSTVLQSSTFGHLSSNADLLNTPRQMQFALKLNF